MMMCPKCGNGNPETAQFCVRCHMTLRFTCPACQYVKAHGGTCDTCGVDFVKYATLLQFQLEQAVRSEREHAKARSEAVKQVALLPLTGGWSLLKYVKSALSGE